VITFRGSQEAVLKRLYGYFTDPDFCFDQGMLGGIQRAISEVRGGAWLAVAGSWFFEVIDPPMSVEQNVYGCAEGRSCTNVPAGMRPGLDAMIMARSAEGRGADDRHFHWYWTLDRLIYRPDDVRMFVMDTLGSSVVADAARVLYRAITEATSYPDNTDVHVTLLPDRMRLRVDTEGGRGWAGDPAKLPEVPGPDGVPVKVGEFLTDRASCWGVIGARPYSVWADFPRIPGDVARLAVNRVTVPAAKIPPGAYVYREKDHLAWVPVAEVVVAGHAVRLVALDEGELPIFAANELVPIFAPYGVASS
jgi:hypothetical protein